MKNDEPVICPIHGNTLYPFWSKKKKNWFVICNAEYPKTHFVNHPNDERSLEDYFDKHGDIEKKDENE